MSYDIGDVKRVRLDNVRNDEETLTDPTTVTLTIREPSGLVVTRTLAANEVIKEKTGYFFYDLALTEDGIYQGRWATTGGVDLNEPIPPLVVGSDPIVTDFADPNFDLADIWARSAYLKATYPQAGASADFAMLVGVVAPLVGSLTGREIAGSEGEAVPTSKLEIAMKAIAMKAEQFDNATGTRKARRRSMGRGNLASFSAGSYSESYFGAEQVIAAKKMDADPILAELLWELCTEAKKAEWLALWDPEGYPEGVGGFVSFEYGNRPNYGGAVGAPPRGW